MASPTAGIHHVTAISGSPQGTLDFYAGTLGLRLVKRTVNFDDPETYHLYFGDLTGTPDTVLTFFPIPGAGRGTVGTGQATAAAFAIPEDAVDHWIDRLDDLGVDADPPAERFGETVLRFRDDDGQPLELVAAGGGAEPWVDGPVPAEYAIRGFHGVTLTPTDPAATIEVLEGLGFERSASTADRTRLRAGGDRAAVVDVRDPHGARPGRGGPGTIHHVAFRTPDDEAQFAHRDRLIESGHHMTGQKDRQYFRSIYFREPGGVLFELATDGPGFTRDEAPANLGTALALPPWLEKDRDVLERQLPPLAAPEAAGAG